MFDYPLYWVVCSTDLVMYTGDVSYAETYWPNLIKALDQYYPSHTNKTSSLLDKPSSMGDYAFLPRSGEVTYYSALYVHAMQSAARLATALGKQDDADRWTSRAARVSKALIERNYDASVGAFYDGEPCPDGPAGTICDVHAQDGNSIAVLAGITNHTLSTNILNYWERATARQYGNAFYDNSIISPGSDFQDRVYAFISFFELSGRFLVSGASASAFDEIRRLYGWMTTHDPNITMWEGIGKDGSPYEGGYTSMAHGWSTGIVPLLSNYVLGVTPQGPGFTKWQVCPVITGGGLTWARGVVPTPEGALEVSWDKKDSGRGMVFTMTIQAPEGTQGSVCIPTMGFANRKVRVDGRVVQQDSSNANSSDGTQVNSVRINLRGGRHVVTVGVV